jgi:hypothetical protein
MNRILTDMGFDFFSLPIRQIKKGVRLRTKFVKITEAVSRISSQYSDRYFDSRSLQYVIMLTVSGLFRCISIISSNFDLFQSSTLA